MEQFIIFTLGVIAGLWLANRFHRFIITLILHDLGIRSAQQLREVQSKLEQQQEPAESAPVPVKLEQHNGMIYAYRTDTQEFLGQGSDQAALYECIGQRFKNIRLLIENPEILKTS